MSTVAERNRLRDETQKAFLAIRQQEEEALRAKLARLRAQRLGHALDQPLGHALEETAPDRVNT